MMDERWNPGRADRIGRYRLLRRLGEGGMGEVLLAVGPDGRLVAVKRVHAHLIEQEDFLPRFRREVQASARVSGAFTAAVVDYDVESENPWLASVFVPGVPLDRAVEKYGPLSVDAIHALALGLATALQAIHATGLVHRDLKPANIILAADGPKVIDFGIARVAAERSDLTHTGSIIGSPAFMSPEQAESQPLTPASDVFSFGSVIAMAASGKSPFAGSSMPHTLYKIVNTEPDLSMLPPNVRQLVEPCLYKDPAQRPTPGQIIDFLGPSTASSTPWPPAILQAMREQDQELRMLVADPQSTVVVDPNPTASTMLGGDFDEVIAHMSRKPPRQLPGRWIIAALVAVVALVAGLVTAVVGGAFSGEDAAAPANPLEQFNLTRLRLIDVCKVLDDPLPSLGAWKQDFQALGSHQCSGDYEKYVVSLEIANISSVEKYQQDGKSVQGVPVAESTLKETYGCSRALVAKKMDPQFGLVVKIAARKSDDTEATKNECELAEQALPKIVDRLHRPPQIANSRHTIVRLDPCSVVPPVAIRLDVGPPVSGVLSGLHDCVWVGQNTLDVSLSHEVMPTGDPIDLGEFKVWPSAQDSNTQCTRKFVWGNVDNDLSSDVMEVQITRESGGTEQMLCNAAEAVVNMVAEQLPQP
ncbi:serine/threonine-protein kinase [Nocardia macrotermitis]|uniref:Serine/threonine-protein kinase PknD n=1 Tax=Nocardia macrotermitis TaxID=2585198 RepID=A0A7K0D0H8_9NOCA|nr:serine/threonine-protein kinase [Nocardia macrotermitis]MQY19229.1 Serine/threonine-protein kinase PknD [Nocardia macrotermitis]